MMNFIQSISGKGIIIILGYWAVTALMASLLISWLRNFYNQNIKLNYEFNKPLYEYCNIITRTHGFYPNIQYNEQDEILDDYYDCGNDIVVLTAMSKDTTSPADITVAFHELGHAYKFSRFHIFPVLNRLRKFISYVFALAVALLILSTWMSSAIDNKLDTSCINVIYICIVAYLIFMLPDLFREFIASKTAVKYLREINTPEYVIDQCKKLLTYMFLTYVLCIFIRVNIHGMLTIYAELFSNKV